MAESKSEILQDRLDPRGLGALTAMGQLHGYGSARRVEQIREHALPINQGTIYASRARLLQRGSIPITKVGRKELSAAVADCERISGVIIGVLQVPERS